MTYQHCLRLVEYLKRNEDRILSQRPRYATVAWQATNEIGMRCTESNVQTAAQACGMHWIPRKRSTNGSHASSRYTSRILARAIAKIARELDIEIDENVHHIAGGRAVNIEQETCEVAES